MIPAWFQVTSLYSKQCIEGMLYFEAIPQKDLTHDRLTPNDPTERAPELKLERGQADDVETTEVADEVEAGDTLDPILSHPPSPITATVDILTEQQVFDMLLPVPEHPEMVNDQWHCCQPECGEVWSFDDIRGACQSCSHGQCPNCATSRSERLRTMDLLNLERKLQEAMDAANIS